MASSIQNYLIRFHWPDFELLLTVSTVHRSDHFTQVVVRYPFHTAGSFERAHRLNLHFSFPTRSWKGWVHMPFAVSNLHQEPRLVPARPRKCSWMQTWESGAILHMAGTVPVARLTLVFVEVHDMVQWLFSHRKADTYTLQSQNGLYGRLSPCSYSQSPGIWALGIRQWSYHPLLLATSSITSEYFCLGIDTQPCLLLLSIFTF